MTAFITVLNAVRATASPGWLTTEQRTYYEGLAERARMYQPSLLTGPPGSGKTFIAWMLHREIGALYTSDPNQIPTAGASQEIVIVDNADCSGLRARDLLARAHLNGWTTVILCARDFESAGIPSFRLTAPSHADIAQCIDHLPIPLQLDHHLTREVAEVSATSAGDTENLWRVIRRGLRISYERDE